MLRGTQKLCRQSLSQPCEQVVMYFRGSVSGTTLLRWSTHASRRPAWVKVARAGNHIRCVHHSARAFCSTKKPKFNAGDWVERGHWRPEHTQTARNDVGVERSGESGMAHGRWHLQTKLDTNHHDIYVAAAAHSRERKRNNVRRQPGQPTFVFTCGVPGAGKTFALHRMYVRGGVERVSTILTAPAPQFWTGLADSARLGHRDVESP